MSNLFHEITNRACVLQGEGRIEGHTHTHAQTNKQHRKTLFLGSKGLFTRSTLGSAFSQEVAPRGFWVMRYVSVSQSLPCDSDGFLLSGDKFKSCRETEVVRDTKWMGCSLRTFFHWPVLPVSQKWSGRRPGRVNEKIGCVQIKKKHIQTVASCF